MPGPIFSHHSGINGHPCTHKPFWEKGVGEPRGNCLATPHQSRCRALSPLGVPDMTMPASPEKVWGAHKNVPGPKPQIGGKGNVCKKLPKPDFPDGGPKRGPAEGLNFLAGPNLPQTLGQRRAQPGPVN
ncbi:MAG: hypothetical protein CM15mP46_5840 [Alphaproteobacteria bacterium]|nr:MAG: hypothetical protein CM15mP46_5840 [Alphaproteobacteria bacterium]